PAVAALLNGALGHSLDFDDTHADSSLHPSAPVVPAAFAVGEMAGRSGRDVLTAIVAGYEVCCRLGNALDPTSHYARGFHPTATAGTYGAAAAAAKVFGLSKGQIVAAFGVSGTHAALDAIIAMRREHNLTPAQVKRVEIGLHRNGITLTGDAATKRHPTSIVGGQFSMYFTGAVALDQGRFGWDDYDRLGDAAVD